jgi:hypothetical protein
MTVAISDHDEGSALDPFAAEAAPGAGGPPGMVAALQDEDATSLFPSEHVTSDHEEPPDPALDEFAGEADAPPGITLAPKDEDSVLLFPSGCVTPVGNNPLAQQSESVFVSQPVPRHHVPLMEVPFVSSVGSESPSREIPRGQWRGAAAAIAIAVLISTGLLGTLVIDRQTGPLPAAPVNSPARLPPLPAQPTAERPAESVTGAPAAPPSPLRSEGDDAGRSLEAATRTTVRDRAVTVAPAPMSQPREPASRPTVPPPSPSTSGPAPRAEPMLTANVPTSDVPTKTPPAAALTGVGSTTAGVAAPAASTTAGVPAPAAIAVPPPDPAPAPGVAETEAVASILTRYRSAFSALDASAVEAFWPSVNSKALASAFGQLEAQSLDFGTCQIDVQGSRAQAVCSGWASFVPKVGGNRRRVEARQWTFHLIRTGTTWLIARVDAR